MLRRAWTVTVAVLVVLAVAAAGAGDGLAEGGHKVDASRSTTTTSSSSSSSSNAPHGRGCQPLKSALMLVSTLDGKLSALNVEKEGKLEWTVNAGASPLLSSTIGNLEVMRNGKKNRLIPSLDGALYHYDGESVEPMPFTADTLLTSSFKFSVDSTIVGGKESLTYGIDPASGAVRYVCGVDGCKHYGGTPGSKTDPSDLLMLSRLTRTVRAVDMMTGYEKWNFSVGQHEVTFMRNTPMNTITESISTTTRQSEEYDEDVTIASCNDYGEEEEEWLSDFASWFNQNPSADDLNFKVVVPKGIISAVDKFDATKTFWEHKFDSPVAGAWTLRDGKLESISLFDGRTVPALEAGRQIDTDGENEGEVEVMQDPLLYVGIHDEQLYVQPSECLADEVEQAVNEATARDTPFITTEMPRVRWRPYLASALSRTPMTGVHRNPLQLAWVKTTLNEDITSDKDKIEIAQWHEQYPFDGGYYLFPDTSPFDLSPHMDNYTFRLQDVSIIISSYMWWKQLVAITFLMAYVIHMATNSYLTKLIFGLQTTKSETAPSMTKSSEKSNSDSLESQESQQGGTKPKEFESRFMKEFDQKACLGKGGFGVVFEAVNKMDESTYAVKRIALNNSENARKKVMREVKALAKVDHVSIVRYFQAWFENPPPGWQEEHDRHNLDLSLSPSPYPTPVTTPGMESPTRHSTKDVLHRNPLKPPDSILPQLQSDRRIFKQH